MVIEMVLFLLTVSASISDTVGFSVFASEENELVYDYNSAVTVSINDLEKYASKFYLIGKLHVQRKTTSLLLRLSSLTFKLYNGLLRDGYDEIMDEIPISNQYEDLLRIFKIDYSLNGHVENITTEMRENIYARNIKKSLASILQIDLRCVSDNKTQEFVTEEFSIWENQNTSYNVIKTLDGLQIEKKIRETIIPAEFVLDEKKHDLMLESTYFISNLCLVEKIDNAGFFIFKDNIVQFNQSLKLVEIGLVAERFEIFDEQTQNMSYLIDDLVLLGVNKETLSSGFEVKCSAIYNNIQELFIELQKFRNDENADSKIGNIINQLIHLLRSFQTLEMVNRRITDWSLGNKNYLTLFHQVIPYVGTQASHVLVKQLLQEDNIFKKFSVRLLPQLPFHLVQNPNISILEDFLKLDDTLGEVAVNTAALAFANFVSKTSEHEEVCKKYINYFMKKFVTLQYDKQLLYVIAAANTNCIRAQLFLISVIQNSTYSLAIRQWTMRRLPYLLKSTQKVFDTFWPILADKTQLSSIRKTAYVLIVESKVSDTQFLQIHNYIDKENNKELYEYHCSYLSHLLKNTERRYFKNHINDILSLMQNVNRTEPSGYYELSLDVGYTVFLTYDSIRIFMCFKPNDKNNLNKVLVNIDGAQITFDSSFKNVTFLIPELNSFKVDVMIEFKSQVTHLMTFNTSNFRTYEKIMNSIWNHENFQLKYNILSKVSSKSNSGIPFTGEYSEMVVYQRSWKMDENFGKFWNVQISGDYYANNILQNKLKFYNPLADAWQGAKFCQRKTSKSYINVSANIFLERDVYKVSLDVLLNESQNFVNNNVSDIFVNEGTYYNEVLSKSCESCQNWYVFD